MVFFALYFVQNSLFKTPCQPYQRGWIVFCLSYETDVVIKVSKFELLAKSMDLSGLSDHLDRKSAFCTLQIQRNS